MEINKIEALIEALLFASGDSVSLSKLAEIIDIDEETLKTVIDALADKYNYEKKGFKIIKLEDRYQLTTRGEYAEYIQQLVEPRTRRPLSVSAMEVLAVVSYKQPVTRQQIEAIRGVNCDYAVTRLLERGLIEEKGRLDAPGKPVLFGTTEEFLRCFGISSLKDLPELDGLEILPFLENNTPAEQEELPLVDMSGAEV